MPSALRRLPALVPLFVFLLPGCESSTEPLPIDDPDPEELVPVCASSVDAVSSFLGITGPGAPPGPASTWTRVYRLKERRSISSSWPGSSEAPGMSGTLRNPSILIGEIFPSRPREVATGTSYSGAKLTCRKASGDGLQEYLVIQLEDAIVVSYDTGAGGEEAPTESVSFTYQKIEWTWEG